MSFALGWTIGVTGLMGALAGTSPEPRGIRAGSRLARIGVSAMAVSSAGSLWLTGALSAEAPAIGLPTIPIALMAAATAWAAAALCLARRERPSRRYIA